MVTAVGGGVAFWSVGTVACAVTAVALAVLLADCAWAAWSRGEATIGERVWNGVFLDVCQSVMVQWRRLMEPQVVAPLVDLKAVEALPEKTRELYEACSKWSTLSLSGNLLEFVVCDFAGNRFLMKVTDRWLKVNGYPLAYDGLSEKALFVVFWSLIYNELPEGSEEVIDELEEFVGKDQNPLASVVCEEEWNGDRYFFSGSPNLVLQYYDSYQKKMVQVAMDAEVLAACCTVAREKLFGEGLKREFTYDLIDAKDEAVSLSEDYGQNVETTLNLAHDYAVANVVNRCMNMKLKAAWEGQGSLAERVMRMGGVIDERATFATEIDLSYIKSKESTWTGGTDTVSYEMLFLKIRERCPNLTKLTLPNDQVAAKDKVFTAGWQQRSMGALHQSPVFLKAQPRSVRAALAFRVFLYTGDVPDVLRYQYNTLKEDLLAIKMDSELRKELNRAF